MSKKTEIEVNGRKLIVSNLEKVLYPEVGFTKADVIDYYIRIAPVLLPYLKDRPITLKRYPDGVEGFFFYEKQCPSHRPKWMKTTKVPSKREEGHIDYCVMNDLPALVWAANLADLELHTFLHKAPAISKPTALAFDLDPGPPADIATCCEVAMHLKGIFDALGLQSFAKTSGSKGLQIYVPLNTATNYDRTKDFAKMLAEQMDREVSQARGRRHEEVASDGEGSHRLEPERRAQDDGQCLFASGETASDSKHAGNLGGGRGSLEGKEKGRPAPQL